MYLRNRTQSWLTQATFLRSNVEDAIKELLKLVRATRDEGEYLVHAAEVVAAFVRTGRYELTKDPPFEDAALARPVGTTEAEDWRAVPWVQAVVPLRLSRGDTIYLLLGPRDGARRYLSEDFCVLMRLGAAVVEHVEQLRSIQMQGLVSQAELKALQPRSTRIFSSARSTPCTGPLIAATPRPAAWF